MSGKLNRRNVRQFRALHYVSAIWLLQIGHEQRAEPSDVVPAKAGTHNHRLWFGDDFDNNYPAHSGNHAVWVPAFAGTTAEMAHGISYTTILSAMPRRAACFWIGLISRR